MSAVYLFPDDSIGLFVADNGYSGDLVFDVLFHLMKRYLPATPVMTPKPDPANVQRLRKYAGFYENANHPQSNLEKAGGIRNQPLEVRVTDSGTVSVFGVQFVETAPRFLHEVKGWETLVFMEDPNGKVTGMITTYPFPGTQVWKRVPFIRIGVPSQAVMTWTLILALVLLVRPPRLREGSRWENREAPLPAGMIRWSATTTRIVRALAATQLAFLVLMWLGARTTGGMLYGVPWQMDAAGIIAVIGAAVLAGMIVRLGIALLRSDWSRIKLAPLIGVAVSSTLFVLLQYYWNLLGIHH
jgi:hypothetical protein